MRLRIARKIVRNQYRGQGHKRSTNVKAWRIWARRFIRRMDRASRDRFFALRADKKVESERMVPRY